MHLIMKLFLYFKLLTKNFPKFREKNKYLYKWTFICSKHLFCCCGGQEVFWAPGRARQLPDLRPRRQRRPLRRTHLLRELHHLQEPRRPTWHQVRAHSRLPYFWFTRIVVQSDYQTNNENYHVCTVHYFESKSFIYSKTFTKILNFNWVSIFSRCIQFTIITC